MGVRAVSSTSVLLPVGGQWRFDVAVADIDVAPSVVVTLPDDSTASPAAEAVGAGRFRAAYTVDAPGRYVAAVTAGGDAAVFAAHVLAVTDAGGMPAPADVVAYLGETSHTEDEVQGALEAEAAAQRAVCRVGAVYPADLREALLRRVARNLAMRALPLAMPQGDADVSVGVLPGRDPEVRRLEGPHRKLTVG